MTYAVVETTDLDAWDAWVDASPEGTVFHTSAYLRALGCKYKLFFVHKGDARKAAFLAPVTPNERNIVAAPYLIYGGFFFHDEEASRQPRQQKNLSQRFRITEALVDFMSRTFDNIHISCGPAIADLRPFLWHNHSGDRGARYLVTLRYTSYLDIQDINQATRVTLSPGFQRLSGSRRQEIRLAMRDGICATEGSDVQDFLRLTELAFADRDDDPKRLKQESQALSSVVHALTSNGQGKLYYVKNGAGQTVSASFWGLDTKRAYFLFAANHPQAKERYSGTMAVWDALRHLNGDYNVTEVDLEGVNSPQRGWFKLSFGGDIRPYHHVTLRQS